MNEKSLPIEDVRLDGDTQVRTTIDSSLVREYREQLCPGDDQPAATFPPIVVFFDGASYWLADGFHRYHARRQLGQELITCQVITGTLEDARIYAVRANVEHGKRRSKEDVANAIRIFLTTAKGQETLARRGKKDGGASGVARYVRCAVSYAHEVLEKFSVPKSSSNPPEPLESDATNSPEFVAPPKVHRATEWRHREKNGEPPRPPGRKTNWVRKIVLAFGRVPDDEKRTVGIELLAQFPEAFS